MGNWRKLKWPVTRTCKFSGKFLMKRLSFACVESIKVKLAPEWQDISFEKMWLLRPMTTHLSTGSDNLLHQHNPPATNDKHQIRTHPIHKLSHFQFTGSNVSKRHFNRNSFKWKTFRGNRSENDAAVAVMVAVFPRIIGLKRLMARSLQVVIISLRKDNIHLIWFYKMNSVSPNNSEKLSSTWSRFEEVECLELRRNVERGNINIPWTPLVDRVRWRDVTWRAPASGHVRPVTWTDVSDHFLKLAATSILHLIFFSKIK